MSLNLIVFFTPFKHYTQYIMSQALDEHNIFTSIKEEIKGGN